MQWGYCPWPRNTKPNGTSHIQHNKDCYELDNVKLLNHKGDKYLRLTRVVNNIRKNAYRRGLAWELSTFDAATLLTQNCGYCGAAPTHLLDKDATNPYNGIDRVDNNFGYVDNNVITCCRRCNIAKGTLTIQEFKTLITNIYKHFVKD